MVNRVNPDAFKLIKKENSFNDAPPKGSVYVMINITARYTGPKDKDTPMFPMSGVTSSNIEYKSYDTTVVTPGAFDSFGDVFAGGDRTGNVVLTVPAAEVGSLVLYTHAGFEHDDVYFAVK